MLQPEFSDIGGIERSFGNLESAIRIEDRRIAAVEFHVNRMNDEVWHFGPVAGNRLELFNGVARGVKLWQQGFDLFES
jgi:hypothetical protein